jgi:hypothetical protein
MKGRIKAARSARKSKREHTHRKGSCCPDCGERMSFNPDAVIKADGYGIIQVSADPPYLITIGLTESVNFPELIIMGHHAGRSVDQLLKLLVVTWIGVGKFPTEEIYNCPTKDGTAPIGLKPVSKKERLKTMFLAKHRYGDDGFKAVQLVIPDEKKRLPWDAGYNREGDTQLLLYKHCGNCYKNDVPLSKCSGCEHVRYCDEACQLANWKIHKHQCRE